MKFLIPLCILILTPFSARAEMTWDSSFFYFSDTFTTDTDSVYSLMAWSTSLNFEVGKSKYFYFGWDVMGFSQTRDTGTTSTYSSMEMGPRLMLLSKSKIWQLAVSYHLSSTNSTTYDPGTGTDAKLKGTALFVELGYLPEISPGWHLGLKLNYYAPSFTESVVNDTEYSQISYTRATMYPVLGLSYMW